MRAFVLAVFLIACVCASSLEFKTSVVQRPEKLREGRDASERKIVAAQSKEVHCNMSGFRKTLDEYKEAILKELTLSEEEKKDVRDRLQMLKPRTPCDGAKTKGDSIEGINTKSGVIGMLFQGDILLSREQQQQILAQFEGRRSKRQAYNDKTYPGRRWYQGVHYSFDGNLPNETRNLFKVAVQWWTNNTCINFYEDENETSHDLLIVFKERGCWSEVGRQGDWQFLSLGETCDTIGVVAHEIGHALGFWHTHSRYDRDEFITVLNENINDTYIDEFLKQSNDTNNNYGLTYDYGSVMHYGATAGATEEAKQAKLYTMVPKDAIYTETLGSPFLAFYDVLMMNMYYNCTDACKGVRSRCHNEGFPHPRNCSVCICPSGYGGQFCNERPPGCGAVLRATRRWNTLEHTLNGSETGSDGYNRCYYWIEAPEGRKVEIKIVQLPVEYAADGCVFAGVEIKTHSDKRRTGYRFCSSAFLNMTLKSNSNVVPIITYSREGLGETNLVEHYYVSEDEEEELKEEFGEEAFSDEDEGEVENEEEEQLSTETKLMYRIYKRRK